MTASADRDVGFEHAWSVTQQLEGGYTVDQGGPTMGGVTQDTFDRWLGSHHQPARPVITSTLKERSLIAWEWYWIPAHCAELPQPADLLQFDCAFNAGPLVAVKILQRALHVKDDGTFGSVSRGALKNNLILFGLLRVMARMLWGRQRYYAVITRRHPERHLGSLTGWVWRLEQLAAEVKLT